MKLRSILFAQVKTRATERKYGRVRRAFEYALSCGTLGGMAVCMGVLILPAGLADNYAEAGSLGHWIGIAASTLLSAGSLALCCLALVLSLREGVIPVEIIIPVPMTALVLWACIAMMLR